MELMELSKQTLEELFKLGIIDEEDIEGEEDADFTMELVAYIINHSTKFSDDAVTEAKVINNSVTADETADELEILKEKLEDTIFLIKHLIRCLGDSRIKERAKAYWLPSIEMAISNDHEYLGKSMFTIANTIEELRKQ